MTDCRFDNPDYSKAVIDCTADNAFFTPLGLRLRNVGRVPGQRIRFVGWIARSGGMAIREWIDKPPSRYLSHFDPPILESQFRSATDIDLGLREHADKWEIDIDFGDVRPKDEVWTTGVFFMGSTEPGTSLLEGELRGDNLPEAIKCRLDIRFDVDRRPMNEENIQSYQDQ